MHIAAGSKSLPPGFALAALQSAPKASLQRQSPVRSPSKEWKSAGPSGWAFVGEIATREYK